MYFSFTKFIDQVFEYIQW